MVSLRKNIFYSSILTAANYVFPLLTYPYVSRVLGVSNIGICNFVDSLINYFSIVSILGIGTVGIREISRVKHDKKHLESTFSKIFTIHTISGSLTPFSKTKQFYLLIDFLLKVFFLSNLIRIFVALYGTIAL